MENSPETLPFSSLKVGQTGTVAAYSKKFPAYRKKLMAMGLTSGTPFTVIRVAPFGDPVEIMVRGSMISLRKEEADAMTIIMDS